MSRGRTDLALSYTMDRFADGNCNTAGDFISGANGGTTTINLSRLILMGEMSGNSANLRFLIPTSRIFPEGTTINSISFGICCRAGNANSTGMYIVKKTSGGSDFAQFDSNSTFTFYDGSNTSRSLAQSSITKSVYARSNIFIEFVGTSNYFFTGNSTNNGYCNNQPVCVDLSGTIITLNTPYYQPQNIPSSVPITPITDDISTVLGNVYSASWTASSSTANGSQLTESITLPPGTYIITGQFPGMSTAGVFGYHNIPNKYCYATADTDCETNTIIITLTETTQIWLTSATASTMTFTNLERGGLTAIRIR